MSLRVLWLTNVLMPDLANRLSLPFTHRAGWIPALADALMRDGRAELGVATNVAISVQQHHVIDGVHHYAVPMPSRSFRYENLPVSLVAGYQRVVDDFKPDVIHVHGTEYFHGLLTGRGYLDCPAVISIQGIIDACQKYYTAGLPWQALLLKRTIRDWARLDGLWEQRQRWERRARFEREIFATNRYFVGRTLWDQAQTRRLNPAATYFHCEELLRPVFYSRRWSLDDCQRHSVFASSASYPIKGFHVLIKAVALLRDEFPDLVVRSPLLHICSGQTGLPRFFKEQRGGGYAKFLADLIRENNVQNHFVPLGELSAERMAQEYARAHVFVLPSYVENSPNSLAEAMLLGTPSVVSLAGGIPSMIVDGQTALAFPSGDEAVLAEQIRRIWVDDDGARCLSLSSRKIAEARHAEDAIVRGMCTIYEQVRSAR